MEKQRAATDTKTRLESEPLIIEMPAGERGRLFGSVTSTNIADALAAKGIEVERRRIDIPEKTIKNLGTTYVRVRLYGDEEAELRVDVTGAGAPAGAPAGAESTPAASEPVAATRSPGETAEAEEAAVDETEDDEMPEASDTDE